MSLIYTCGTQVIESALARLKNDGLVAKSAYFNFDAIMGLRDEVAYRDFDFLTRLSRTAEVETASSILVWLKEQGILSEGMDYDAQAFGALRKEVQDNFVVPGTSITPVMERLLYMLSSVRQPQRIIGLGTYCGYALVWVVGASCGLERVYSARQVYGIDINEEITQQARQNFRSLPHTEHVDLIAEDGLKAVDRLEGPFDYVYLDVDSKELGKGIYLDLLKRLYGKIEEGGWVLAHDTAAPPFKEQLEGYLSYVRDGNGFKESISFDVDPYGLELTIK